MKWTMAAATALTAVALAACGGGDGDETAAAAPDGAEAPASDPSTPAGAVDALLTQMDAIADALESVTDEKTAEEAARTIRRAAERMQEVSDANPDMRGPAGIAAFTARGDEFMQTQNRLAQAAMALEAENPEAVDIINDAMADIRMPGQ